MKISDSTAISMPMRNLLSILAAVGIGVWAYFGVIERLNNLETKATLAEKDLTSEVQRIDKDIESLVTGDIAQNNEFRIKWPRGDLGSPPADSEQFMLIEFLSGQVESLTKQLEGMMNNKVNIERLQTDMEKSLEDIGSKIVVTTDSSSPDRAVVFGTYYTRFSIKKGTFESLNFPNEKHNPDIIDWFRETPNQDWPRMTSFDDVLRGLVSWKDVADWNTQCTMGMRLHNFYVFKDAIRMVTELVYGHDYILEQAINSEVYKVLHSIDEMVKSDNPGRVFEKYKQLYMKMSNTKKELNTNTKHKFF